MLVLTEYEKNIIIKKLDEHAYDVWSVAEHAIDANDGHEFGDEYDEYNHILALIERIKGSNNA